MNPLGGVTKQGCCRKFLLKPFDPDAMVERAFPKNVDRSREDALDT